MGMQLFSLHLCHEFEMWKEKTWLKGLLAFLLVPYLERVLYDLLTE